MNNSLGHFVRKYTPIGRYFTRVEIGTELQRERLQHLDDPTWTARLKMVVQENNISGRLENLLMGRH